MLEAIKLESPLTVKLEKPSYPELGDIVYVTLLGVIVLVYKVGAALPDWTTIAKKFGILRQLNLRQYKDNNYNLYISHNYQPYKKKLRYYH